jgi:hypothetical protein
LRWALLPSKYLNIIESVKFELGDKGKIEKKSLFKSKLPHGINHPNIVDFSTNDPNLPKVFFIRFYKHFPHVVVFIPFISNGCIFWSKKYVSAEKEYKNLIIELMKNNFQVDFITSDYLKEYTWSSNINILSAMFHKKNASGKNIVKTLEVLKKIDLTINDKSSEIIPIENEEYNLLNYSGLDIYRCLNCDNLYGFRHRGRDRNIFKYLPPKCSFCTTSGNYEKNPFFL